MTDRVLLLRFLTDADRAERGLKRLGKVIVGAIATDKILDFGKAALSMADDVEQSEGKLDQLLGSQAKAVKSFARQAKGLGISRRNTLKYTSSLAALMRVQGANRKEAARSSVQWVRLAADMAAFNNAAPDDVLRAMQSALAGEFDPLKRFGVLLSATRVQQYAWNKGIADARKPLTDRQRLLATQGLLLEQTRLQQGQLGRESDTLGAKQNRLNAIFEDFQTAIGGRLLGPMSDLAGFVADDVVPALGNMADAFGRITGLGPDAAASLVVVAGALGILAALALAHPVIAVAAAIAALTVAAALLVNSGVLQDFHDQAMNARHALRSGEGADALQRAILGAWAVVTTVGSVVTGFFDDVATSWRGAQEAIRGDFSNLFATLTTITAVAFAPLTALFRVFQGAVEGVFDQLGINLPDRFGQLRDAVVGIARDMVNGVIDLLNRLHEVRWSGGTIDLYNIPQELADFLRIPANGKFVISGGSFQLFPRLAKVGEVPAPVGTSAPGKPPRHLHGLPRVPRDDYLMLAHRDEAVLDRYEAREWRSGGSGAVTAHITVEAPVGADGARVGQQIAGYLDQWLARGGRFRYRPVGGTS